MLPSPSDSCEFWGEALLHGEASYKVILWNGDRGPAGRHFVFEFDRALPSMLPSPSVTRQLRAVRCEHMWYMQVVVAMYLVLVSEVYSMMF